MICGMPARDFISLVIVVAFLVGIVVCWVLGILFLAWCLFRDSTLGQAILFKVDLGRFWRRQNRRAIRP